MEEETNLEVQSAPEVESAPAAVEQEAPTLDEYGNPVEGPDESEAEAVDPDLDEVEINGKTYKVPKEAALRQADYTRKTQEVAELRRTLETSLQAVQTTTQAEAQARVQIGVIDTQIADYNNIDWDAWEASDPQSANREWRRLQTLKEQRQQAIGTFTQAQQQRTFIEQQETAKQLEQGTRELAAKIPDWNAEKAAKLVDFGQSTYGFSKADLDAITDPRMVIALHDAFQFRQAAKSQQVVKRVEAQQAVKPAAKVTGARPAIKPMDDRTNVDSWMKARQAQLSKR